MSAQKKRQRKAAPSMRCNLLLSTALTGVVLAATSHPSRAATLTVTNLNDSGAGSLRNAITTSNAGDTIVSAPNLTGTLNLGSTLPPVTHDLTINLTVGNITITGPYGLAFTTGTSSLNSQPVNTYSGATALQGGSLSVVGTGGFTAYQSPLVMSAGTTLTVDATAVTGVAPGATFASLSGSGTIALIGNPANLTRGTLSGLVLTGNDAQSTTFSGTVTGTGNLALFGGGGALTLTGTNTYSGSTNIEANVIVGTPAGNRLPYATTLAAGAANVFSPNSAMVMSGGQGAVLALNNYNQTIASLAGQGIVQLGSAVLTLGGDNTSTTFTGGITGTGGLDKVGTGTFTITQSGAPLQATYGGPTLIDGGVVRAGAANSFSPNSPVAIAAGATLDLNGLNQTVAGLAGAGSVTLGSGTLIDNTASSASYGGVISGSGGSLTLQGGGTLTLSSANTYTGTTTVNGGTLVLGSGGSIAASSVLNLNASTFDISTAGNQKIQDLFGSAGSKINLGGNTLTAGDVRTTSFGGVISGSGGFTKQGAGTLTLSSVNTYAGQTLVSNGTLALSGAGSVASSSSVYLQQGAKFDVSGVTTATAIQDLGGDQQTTVTIGNKLLLLGGPDFTTFSGSFAGNGSLLFNGTGGITLLGDSSSFSGALGINSGQVSIGSDTSRSGIFGGSAAVNGGLLTGFGTIVGNLTNNGGTVRPGGSIGTLTVNGNYTQGPGGTLAIEINPTASSQLKVGGAATLAGTLQLIYDPGIYSPATSYKFLTASSVSGAFTTVLSNSPLGIGQTLVIDSTGVSAQLIVVAPTNDTVYTDVTSQLVMNGQRANAIILDRVGNRASGVADGQVALAGAGVTGLQLAQAGNGAMLGDFASALPLATEGAWFRGIGDFGSVGSNGTIPGFSSSAGGFLAGYDRPVTANTYVGLAGGYLHSSVTESGTGSSGGADTARIALYGGAVLGPSLVTGTIGYAHDWTGTTRPISGIGTAFGSYGGNEATAAAQWSMPLQMPGFGQGAVTFTPKAGLQFLHLSEESFNENGAGGFNLSSSDRSTDSLQPFIAFSAAQKFATAGGVSITPEVRLGYSRETLSGSRTLTVGTVSGVQFPVTGIRPSKNIINAGAGVTIDEGPNLAVYATYDGVVPTGNTIAHTVQAGVRLRF